MKRCSFQKSVVLLILSFTLCSQAFGQDFVRAPWGHLCTTAGRDELILTTTDGRSVRGRCLKVGSDEIQISRSFGRTTRVARTAVLRVEVMRKLGGADRVSSFQEEVGFWLQLETASIVTPLAPLGVLSIPPTIIWAAIGTPVYGIMDLSQNHRRQRCEIQLTPEMYPSAISSCGPVTVRNPQR